MYRIVIEPSELEVGQSLYQTLRGHRVPTALHQDALASAVPAKCEYFVASSAFETQVGGTRRSRTPKTPGASGKLWRRPTTGLAW